MLKRRRPALGQYPLSNYVLVKGLPWGANEASFFAGASPAVANGDIANVPYVTAPDNFVLTLTSTGVPVIQSNGSIARQTVLLDVYDMSFRRWYGRVTDYVNDSPPSWITNNPQSYLFLAGVPIIDIDLSTFCSDPQGDQIIISTSDPLPPGLSLAGNILTGTPAQLGTFNVHFNAADVIGLFSQSPLFTFTVNLNAVDETFPDLGFEPRKRPLDVYLGAITSTAVAMWSADSTLVTADGIFSGLGAPPPGGAYIARADGFVYLDIAKPDAALLAWARVIGAESYNVYQNGILVGNTTDIQFTVQGLAYDTDYLFSVMAVVGDFEFQNGQVALRFSSPDQTVTPMTRKIPFPSVGWN